MGVKTPREKGLSGLRLKIFAKLFPVLALLVIAICVASYLFELNHHCKDMVHLFTKVARIHASYLANPFLKNDIAVVKDELDTLIAHELISYVFVEKGGQIYFQVPSEKLPEAVLSEGRSPRAQTASPRLPSNSPSVKKVQDEKGRIFYDIASPIPGAGASLHLLLSRDAIDQHVRFIFVTVLLLGLGTILVLGLFSYFFAVWVTREISHLNKALDKEREQLLSIFDSIGEIIFVVDPHTYEILYANRALHEAFQKDVVGSLCYRELQGRDNPCEFCRNPIVLKEKGSPLQWEYHHPLIDQDFWVTERLIKWPDGREVKFVLAINITERKKAEQRLKESEERYRELVMTSIDGVISVNSRMEIVLWNPAAEKIFGYKEEEILGHPILEIIPERLRPTAREGFAEFIKTGSGTFVGEIFQTYGLRKDGTEIPIELSISTRREGDAYVATAIIRDITERKRLEDQLRLAQKMEAIGTLAGGIAHDFNNLLTVINGHAELALFKADQNQALRKHIEQIRQAGEKASQLISQLLAFSRKQAYEPKIIDVNKVLADLAKMLRRLITEDIHLEMILAEDLPTIMADPTQIEQILINLVVNARDAIHEWDDPGAEKKITIETSYVFLDESYVARYPGSQIGPHVLIAVSDTGVGMDEETQQRIFDPFFTTKDVGKGTGLGLATVYGIVKQNNGSIYVYSKPGRGTTFKIYWPAIGEEISPETTNRQKDILGGSEKFLVVEDNEMVKGFISTTLKQLGYQVFEASNGKEALESIREKRFQPDILIADLIMPEMSGDELAMKIREICPDMAVIYMSGYANNHVVQKDRREEGISFLQKPFTIVQLAQKVREVLDKKSKKA